VTEPFNLEDRLIQRSRFGPCQVEVPKKGVGKILVSEILNPFYIFQVFAMGVFWWEGYKIYACCIFIISALSIIATLYDTIRNNN